MTAELTEALDACAATAAIVWPGIRVDRERFARALAERVARDAPIAAAIAALAVEDLYLACACADGDAAALATFEERYGPVIERAIAATGAPEAERADLAQVVRARILVAEPGGVPRIASYRAQGSLAAWLRVIAVREVTRYRSRRAPPLGDSDDEVGELVATDDPELDYMRARYREEFKHAIARAIGELDGRDRLVLRQHAIDRLGIDQLAALHGIHRATAARWIASAREALVRGTRQLLTAALQLSPTELDSVMRLIRSELDVSLPRLLEDG